MLFHNHQQPLKAPNGYKTEVYFSNWSVYQRSHFAIDIPIKYYTHIFYAFILVDQQTGRLKFSDEWCDLQMPLKSATGAPVVGNLQQLFSMKLANRHLKVIMSIGGWGTCHLFEAVMSDKQKLANFIDSAVEFVHEYGFDGVDIDWEYPKNDKDARNYVELLRGLRSKLPNQFSLSIAAPAGAENVMVLRIKEMDQYLSFWNLMCYDFAGEGWSKRTGFHSNLFGNNGDNELNADNVVEHYKRMGVDSSKLILGMPMYGRVFHGVAKPEIGHSFSSSVRKGPDVIDTEIVDYKRIPLDTEVFDPRKVSACNYTGSSQQFIVYDNAQSARIKAGYTRSKQLGGGMWWDSCGDSPDPAKSLVINYVDQLGGIDVLDKSDNVVSYPTSKYLKDLLK
ncbi:chitinase endochitinase 1 precursor [Spathaspora passalidarum NRRL Y-27907]|uniref:chitinase n=1 Tax=Spathaspora passalidarum (strain NRRL Y-27907 / 11-Y1) TaxID=619300 RepID=G3ALM2_SPAPN|nr:chitinase endochitinase 1 precursor [Spathaspora passalidarum NRRL Y-27907]EGW33264.1 chitinase endochitinase 1 precursor [Spathaspora passalidarum NRRL Y-27907]